MLTVSSSGGGDYKQLPAGTHLARCVRIIDLGTQTSTYKGETKTRRQLMFTWEIPGELMDDGRPFTASKFYTASLSEKANLRKDLESWRGKAFAESDLVGFDLTKILNAVCMLSIVEGDNGKTKVNGVMAAPKGTSLPLATNEVYSFDLDVWDQDGFNKLSDGVKRMVVESAEYKAMMAGDAPEPDRLITPEHIAKVNGSADFSSAAPF